MKDLYARDFVPIQGNVFRRADGTTHKVWNLPQQWENSYIIMGAVGGNIYVLFGDDTVVADPTAYSSDGGGSPATIGVDEESPDRIAENTVSRMFIPRGYREGNGAQGATTLSKEISCFAIVGDTEGAEWFAYAITEDHTR